MSWIFGVLSPPHVHSKHHPSAFHTLPLHTVSNQSIYLALGGIPETCLAGTYTEQDGWAVVGLGLQRIGGKVRPLTSSEWSAALSNPNPALKQFDGHFVAVRWRAGVVECFTDQLGLRTLYVSHGKDEVSFSTRLDWLAQYSGKSEIDFAAFGSRWLTFNQLSGEAPVVGIQKLGQGGRAVFSLDSVKIKSTPWLPDGTVDDNIESTLNSFARPVLSNATTISLGLSGGIDSRTLLALIHQDPHVSYSVHTFGHRDDPDVLLSESLAQSLGIDRLYLHEPFPPHDKCISLMREFVGQTQMVEPVSSVVRLGYYSRLRDKNKMMLDGGFGEISRRQYLNRLLLKGKKALRDHDSMAIYPLLKVHRGSFFDNHTNSLMENGTVKRIADLLDTMPDITTFGAENFVDLLAVRTRFPNYGGPEQARLDGELMNYMPFAQPTFLNQMFGLPLSLRRNGSLCRDIIRTRCPQLAAFPMVKNGTTYPFSFPAIPAIVFTRMKRRFGFGFNDPTTDAYLHHIKEFVLDTLHSGSVRTYSAYDYQSVSSLVEGYYQHRTPNSTAVDWWLSFELWRRSLHG